MFVWVPARGRDLRPGGSQNLAWDGTGKWGVLCSFLHMPWITWVRREHAWELEAASVHGLSLLAAKGDFHPKAFQVGARGDSSLCNTWPWGLTLPPPRAAWSVT